MALRSSFENVPLIMDRHFGGTQKGTADPYVTGYQFVFFKVLPVALGKFTSYISNPNGGGLDNNNDISWFLAGSCLSVTPPGGTLNKTEFTGLGGSKWAVPTNFDYGNTLTVKFLEFQNLPVLKIFNSWFRMIREYRTGTSPLIDSGDASPTSYSKKNYSGSMLYWTTRPDGINVEYAALYTGMFPTKDPQDSFSGDVTAVDKLEIDMEFSLDWIWQEPWVYNEATELAKIYHARNIGAHGKITPAGTGQDGSMEERGVI